jgi:hypothetical protein
LVIRACGRRKLGKPEEQVRLPAPSLGAKYLMLNPFERRLKVGEGLRVLSKCEIVQAQIHQGADLHIRHAGRTPKF